MKINYLLIATLLLCLLVLPIFSQEGFVEGQTKSIESGGVANVSSFEIIKDWRVLSLIVVTLTFILVSLAIMFGKAFDIPDLIAWGNTELSQVIATALIILLLIPILSFLDFSLANITTNAKILLDDGSLLNCNVGENCAIKLANAYVDKILETSKQSTRDILKNAEKNAKLGSARAGGYGLTLIWPPLLQASYSVSPSAGQMIYLDLYNTVLEHFVGVFSVLISQKFFIGDIAFNLAPGVFLMGILLRSFFVTRKLGGLLMAAGIGIMYVLPLMYVFDWYTLNITVYGDSVVVPMDGACPAECKSIAPGAYAAGGRTFADQGDLIRQLNLDEATVSSNINNINGIFDGSKASMTLGSTTITSCNAASQTDFGFCPQECRERPYPLSPECTIHNDTAFVEKACNYVPQECIVIRLAQSDPGSYPQCPQECRVVPPLKINCDVNAVVDGHASSCLESKHYCRAARNENGDLSRRFPGCEETHLDDDDEVIDHKNAWACPASTDPAQSCVYILPSADIIDARGCKECLFIPTTYTYDPPVQLNCAELCKANVGPAKISPDQFSKVTSEGMIGAPEIKSLSSLILPAYILPLFNIAVTLMFIRSLSVVLGGDIEIPGVSKIL